MHCVRARILGNQCTSNEFVRNAVHIGVLGKYGDIGQHGQPSGGSGRIPRRGLCYDQLRCNNLEIGSLLRHPAPGLILKDRNDRIRARPSGRMTDDRCFNIDGIHHYPALRAGCLKRVSTVTVRGRMPTKFSATARGRRRNAGRTLTISNLVRQAILMNPHSGNSGCRNAIYATISGSQALGDLFVPFSLLTQLVERSAVR